MGLCDLVSGTLWRHLCPVQLGHHGSAAQIELVGVGGWGVGGRASLHFSLLK